MERQVDHAHTFPLVLNLFTWAIYDFCNFVRDNELHILEIQKWPLSKWEDSSFTNELWLSPLGVDNDISNALT